MDTPSTKTMSPTYFKGDLAEFTGKTEERYGVTFHEVLMLEGHMAGKTHLVRPQDDLAHTPSPPALCTRCAGSGTVPTRSLTEFPPAVSADGWSRCPKCNGQAVAKAAPPVVPPEFEPEPADYGQAPAAMRTHEINQVAHAGQYGVLVDGVLVAGKSSFCGGVTIRHPRLYTTPEAAEEAAAAMGGEPVLLIACDAATEMLEDLHNRGDLKLETDEPLDAIAKASPAPCTRCAGSGLTPTEIIRALDDSLSPEAGAWWNGLGDLNEFIILAQREGLDAAIDAIEDIAKPEEEEDD